MRIGGHVGADDPLGVAEAEAAECVQIFLSNPQSWKAPTPRSDADELRSAAIPIYVHAPYVINVASPNNRIRIPSRKLLQQTCEAAAAIGAAGVVVHGGHVTSDEDLVAGFERWRKALETLESEVPVLIENTAGGQHAMARHFDVIARLWEHIGDLGVGFCLDTCHAHAAGEDLLTAVERIRRITGRIDLVHCNDSKDEAGSGRDRHEHLGRGKIDPDAIVEVVRQAGCDVVCETAEDARAEDIAWLRERLGALDSSGDSSIDRRR
ncbi:MAG: putative endonuclease 4 [Acidimicrobiales bacterium]|nr:MAG: putative endonuclease 4 [Acidimicrobiales bacterium]